MNFNVRHLLIATVLVAFGLTFRSWIRPESVLLVSGMVSVHLFVWWLADLDLLDPRFCKLPMSVLSIAASLVVAFVAQKTIGIDSPLGVVSLIAVVVLVFKIFQSRPLPRKTRLVLWYSIGGCVVTILLIAMLHDGEVIALWTLPNACVALIHLKLNSIGRRRIAWLDKVARFSMWGGVVLVGAGPCVIGFFVIRNEYSADLGNLVGGLIAYGVSVVGWCSVALGVASKMIADPDPSLSRVGGFHLFWILLGAGWIAISVFYF